MYKYYLLLTVAIITQFKTQSIAQNGNIVLGTFKDGTYRSIQNASPDTMYCAPITKIRAMMEDAIAKKRQDSVIIPMLEQRIVSKQQEIDSTQASYSSFRSISKKVDVKNQLIIESLTEATNYWQDKAVKTRRTGNILKWCLPGAAVGGFILGK